MKKIQVIQWGLERSIVKVLYKDTKESKYLIMDNDYLMNLDDMGVVL